MPRPPRLSGSTIAEKLALNSVQDGPCQRWVGAHTRTGYGQLNVAGRRVSVHRLSYEMAAGPIPANQEIDHTCAVRDCINPNHLEAVTHAENVRRTRERLRPVGECAAGHKIAGDNAKAHRSGPICRMCFNARRKRWRAQRKAAAYAPGGSNAA